MMISLLEKIQIKLTLLEEGHCILRRIVYFKQGDLLNEAWFIKRILTFLRKRSLLKEH